MNIFVFSPWGVAHLITCSLVGIKKMHMRTYIDLVTEGCTLWKGKINAWFSATINAMVSFFLFRFLPEHKLLLRQAQSQLNVSSCDSRKHPEIAAAR